MALFCSLYLLVVVGCFDVGFARCGRNLLWILGHDILGLGDLVRLISMFLLREGLLILLAALDIAGC